MAVVRDHRKCNSSLCRHEIPEENKDMAKQNIKDRYRGVNDPVAKKILGRTNNMKSSLAPPEDTSVVRDQKNGGRGSCADTDVLSTDYIIHYRLRYDHRTTTHKVRQRKQERAMLIILSTLQRLFLCFWRNQIGDHCPKVKLCLCELCDSDISRTRCGKGG